MLILWGVCTLQLTTTVTASVREQHCGIPGHITVVVKVRVTVNAAFCDRDFKGL